MTINTVQAAQILGCTKGTVAKLAHTGKLKCLPRDTSKRSYILFDMKDVKEFKQTYKNRMNPARIPNTKTLNAETPTVGIPAVFKALSARIDSIDKKLDRLIQMWS